MPRVGDVFQLLSGTLAVPNTTIQSAPYNAQQNDWVLEANTPRPISAGGTGSTTATGARTSLGAIGATDLATAPTKTAVVGTDSLVIIDSEAANVNKRWLVSDARTVFSTLTDVNFTLISNDAGAAVGPSLLLDRISATPEDNDLGGAIVFRGRTSAAATIVYADMYLKMDDVSVDTIGGVPTPTTDGSLVFRAQKAGTLTTALTLAAGTITVPSSSPTVGPSYIRFQGSTGTSFGYVGAGSASTNTMYLSSDHDMIIVASGDSITMQTTVVALPAAELRSGNFSITGASNGVNISPLGIINSSCDHTATTVHSRYYNPNGIVGSISTTSNRTDFNTSSDENLKDFIGEYDPLTAIDIIRRDPVRDFTWKADGSYAVGWGAQTSHAISSDLASPPPEDDPNAPWGIDQSKRTPYLWAALTWALDRIDDLHSRIKILEEETE